MLITTCTQCLARFRVTPQQLNARQGQVRCGRCGNLFSGFEALERVPDDDTGTRLLAAREALERKAAPSEPPAGPTPPAEPAEELPELEAIDVPSPPAPFRPSAEDQGGAAPIPTRSRAGRARPAPDATATPLDLELEPPRKAVSRAWSFGVALLVLVLATEGAYAYRAPLAQRYPVLRPWLEEACARTIGCAVHWSRDERQLKLEQSDLLEVPGRPDQISLAARIRNLAAVPQEYPDLELTLTDPSGQPAARRVLRPADYLGHAPGRDDVLAAGSEIGIRLRLETPGLKPTGYELLVFYP